MAQKAAPRRSLDLLGGMAVAAPAAVVEREPPPDVVTAVQAAATPDQAFEALTGREPPPPPPTDVSVGRLKTSIAALDDPIAKGRLAVLAKRRAGEAVLPSWVARLQDLERQRLEATWALDSRRIELGLMTVDAATITVSYPTPLAARLSDRAIERTREMVGWRHGCWPDVAAFDPDHADYAIEPALSIAWEQLSQHAHGWDAGNLMAWLQRDVAAHVAVVCCGVELLPVTP